MNKFRHEYKWEHESRIGAASQSKYEQIEKEKRELKLEGLIKERNILGEFVRVQRERGEIEKGRNREGEMA